MTNEEYEEYCVLSQLAVLPAGMMIVYRDIKGWREAANRLVLKDFVNSNGVYYWITAAGLGFYYWRK